MEKVYIPEEIRLILEKIWSETKPVSIFLYGSMARDDCEQNSDYEVGVVYKKDKKVSRSELAEFHNYKNLKLYPFTSEELENGEIDTPFPKAIYLNSLRDSSKTLFGKEIKEIVNILVFINLKKTPPKWSLYLYINFYFI